MHELLNELKTSVHWACQCPSCGRNLTIVNTVGGVTPTGHIVRKKNYPTACALLDVGFMIILKRTDRSVLIWACSAVLTERYNCHFQISQFANKTWTKLQRSLAFATPCCFSKRCLWSFMVCLIQHTKPSKVVYLTGHGPCGCQGSKGFQGSLRGSKLKWSQTSKVSIVSLVQGLQGFKG
jgi:hypothetical protein